VSNQSCGMRDALAKDVAVFGKVPAQSIDALRALMHQKITGPEHDAVRPAAPRL